MRRKKILIFIDWYKPGFKAGGPIRSISNLVDQLHEKVAIYIVTRNTDYLESISYTTVKTDEWNTIDGAQVFYLSSQNTTAKTIKNLIKEVQPNTVYCNSLYSYYFSLLPIYIAKKLHIRVVLAVRGMLSKGSLGVKSRKKLFFLQSAKFIGYFKNVIFHATTLDEKKDIKKAFGKKTTVIVASNLLQKKSLDFHEKIKNNNKLKLVSVARISPEKNTLYALETLKQCKSNIEFDIYGPIYNQEYWLKCQAVINQLPNNIVVNYKGTLNHDDIDITLQNYHTLFLPSTGENFGHIILEAMLNSCVPIISDKTPWKNLENQKIGFDLSLNNISTFVEKIDFLASLSNKDFYEYSFNAYRLGLKTNSSHQNIAAYQQLFHL
ncbi:MAG: glycosyl transferase [Flavobacteriales bacterium CG_4_10_14_0_2_um_filter_32_8]|nr:MAG: glycosyl transferase [Flavobacteriales bacterium CG_4_10_14_0_2_um_filter_32_8]